MFGNARLFACVQHFMQKLLSGWGCVGSVCVCVGERREVAYFGA